MSKIYLLPFLYLLLSCSSRGYKVLGGYDPPGSNVISFDGSFEFYKRKVYKDTINNKALFTLENPGVGNQNLIEIEYMLYSATQNTLIYITTTPDRKQNYYSSSDRLQDDEILNAMDFNTFHFGKLSVQGDEVQFMGLSDSSLIYRWQLDISIKELSILRIIETKGGIYKNEWSVENSIQGGALFEKVPHFRIVFQEGKDDLREMSDSNFYLYKNRDRYCVYLKFDSVILKRISFRKLFSTERTFKEARLFTTIRFEGKKSVPVNPSIVFQNRVMKK